MLPLQLIPPFVSLKTGFRQAPGRGLLWAGGVGGGHRAGQGQTQPCDQSGREDAEVYVVSVPAETTPSPCQQTPGLRPLPAPAPQPA